MARMSDERMNRIDNLRLLMQQNQWNQADLVRALGKSDAYVSKLLNRKTSFGEKAARAIEDKCNKPRGWLDQIHENVAYSADGSSPSVEVRDSASPAKYHEAKSLPGIELVGLSPADTLLPVITWEGIEMLALLNDDPRVADLPHAPAEGVAGPCVKWVILHDESGGERFRPGSRLKVTTNVEKTQPLAGRIVIVRDMQGEHYLRRYVSVTTTRFKAEPLNDGYATLDSQTEQLKVVAVVIQALIDV